MQNIPLNHNPAHQDKLDPNPIPYLTEGVKNLTRTNLKPFFAAIAANLAAPAVLVILAVATMSRYDNAQLLWDATLEASTQDILLIGIGAALIALFVVLIGIVLNRIVLLGVQATHTTFNESLSFSASRLAPAIGIYALIGLTILLPIAAIGLMAWQINPLFGSLYLPLLLIISAVLFFITPLSLIIADSSPLKNIGAVFGKLKATWKHGFIPLILYIFLMNFVSGGMNSFGNVLSGIPTGNDTSSTSQYVEPQMDDEYNVYDNEGNPVYVNPPMSEEKTTLEKIEFDKIRWVFGIFGVIMVAAVAVTTTMQTFLYAGLARLYVVISSKIHSSENAQSPTPPFNKTS